MFSAPGKLQVVSARIPQSTARPEVRRSFVCGADLNRAGASMQRRHRLTSRCCGVHNTLAGHKRNPIGPPSGFLRRHVHAPLVPGGRGRICGVSVGGEIARDGVCGRARLVSEGDRQAVVQERIRRVRCLVGLRTYEGERNFVPLAKFSGDRNGRGSALPLHGGDNDASADNRGERCADEGS